MSAIARFTLMRAEALPGLAEAAVPKKTLFGKTKDLLPTYLAEHGREVADYSWSGYALATVLVYLAEQGLDLMTGEQDELAIQLGETRGATCFIFAISHKRAFLAELDSHGFSEDALRDYYNEFNGADEPDSGQPMLDGIRSFAQCLHAIEDGFVVVFGLW